MLRLIQNLIIRARNLLVAEFPLMLGVALAAAAAASATPVLIVPAVLAAMLRFVVSPAFKTAALKAKVIPPTLAELVEAEVERRLAEIDAKTAPVVEVPAAPGAAPVAVEDAPFTPAT